MRLLCGAAVLAVLVAQLGTEPFVASLGTVGPTAVVAAVGISVLTTMCCAWRWRLVAGGLGVEITMMAAVVAYYRSQFLNLSLPGGIVGDVHRGISNGRGQGDVGRGLRAVAWERAAGQAVQVLVTVAVLLAVPSPLRSTGAALLAVVAAGALAAAVVWHGARPRLATTRLYRAVVSDLRQGVLAPGVRPRVLVASTGSVAGHVLTFCVAAHAATSPAGLTSAYAAIVPVAALVLLVSAVPAHVAGFGPREGAAAWSFGAVGLDPALGVTVSAVYGLLSLAAALPGVVVIAARFVHAGGRRSRQPCERALEGGEEVTARG